MLLLFGVLYRGQAREVPEVRTVAIGDTVLRVEVARTEEQLTTGLSRRRSLKEGTGMLFIFDTEGAHAIWMKDMRFPLDIVWIDENGKVVHIAEDVSPDTYPQSFSSPTPARYVLEVPAGYTTTASPSATPCNEVRNSKKERKTSDSDKTP